MVALSIKRALKTKTWSSFLSTVENVILPMLHKTYDGVVEIGTVTDRVSLIISTGSYAGCSSELAASNRINASIC